jgi:hypothetical protein
LNKIYLIHLYSVGKDKKSLAMVLPSEIVKTLEINPQFVFLILKVKSADNMQLQIIREADLEKKDIEYGNPVDDKVSQSSIQEYDIRKGR